MNPIPFEVPEYEFHLLQDKYPYVGKNGDIGKLAVEIAILYFKSLHPSVLFHKGKKGVDLIVEVENIQVNFEIKGTESEDVAFNKLRVSSKDSHAALVAGMKLLRISNVRNRIVNLYFLEHGVHYELVEEPRWRIKRIK